MGNMGSDHRTDRAGVLHMRKFSSSLSPDMRVRNQRILALTRYHRSARLRRKGRVDGRMRAPGPKSTAWERNSWRIKPAPAIVGHAAFTAGSFATPGDDRMRIIVTTTIEVHPETDLDALEDTVGGILRDAGYQTIGPISAEFQVAPRVVTPTPNTATAGAEPTG